MIGSTVAVAGLPGDAQSRYFLGMVRAQGGDFALATESFEEAVTLRVLSGTVLGLGDVASARRWIDESVTILREIDARHEGALSLMASAELALSEIERRARTHNLFMLVYVQLQKYYNEISQSSTVDVYLKQRKTLVLSNAVHSMRQEAVEKEILQLLGAEQIPAIVMKGNEIAKEIYNDPNCLTSSDIDILIRKKS